MNECDWLIVDIPDEAIEQAKQIRARRNKLYKRKLKRFYPELGELVFVQLLATAGVEGEWVIDTPSGTPTFNLDGCHISVITVRYNADLNPQYKLAVDDQWIHQEADHYVLACYDENDKTLKLLGGIDRERFAQSATVYEGGDRVNKRFVVINDSCVHAIRIRKLTPILEWLKERCPV